MRGAKGSGIFVGTADIGRSYDRVSDHYEAYFLQTMHQYNDQLLEALLARLSKTEPMILDLACGTGYNSAYVRSHLPQATLILADISAGMLAKAKERVTEPALFYQADMLEGLRPFPAGAFDAIICCWAIKYHRPHAVIAQCARLLRPGGYLAVMLNTKDTLPEIRKAYARLLSRRWHQVKKVMLPLPNPLNCRTFDGWFRRAGLMRCVSEQGEQRFDFADPGQAVEFVTSTGALAGYDVMLDLHDGLLQAQLADILARQGQCQVTHRFVWGVYQKPELALKRRTL